jgi:hypothetical protein
MDSSPKLEMSSTESLLSARALTILGAGLKLNSDETVPAAGRIAN